VPENCKNILEKNIFSYLNLNYFCCMRNHKLRTECDFYLQPTANKGYWRNFCVFSVFNIHTSRIFLREIVFVFDKKNKKCSKFNNFVLSGQMRIIAELLKNSPVCLKRFS